MKLYEVKEIQSAKDIRHYIRLQSDLIRFRWLRSNVNTPKNVSEAVNTLESFIVSKIEDMCDEYICDLSDDAEEIIIKIIKKEPSLRQTLGSGVIISEDDAKAILTAIEEEKALSIIKTMLEKKKNIVLL